MAFTSAQAAQIRRYLGYPDLFRYKNTRLESAITVVGDDPDASALIVADLATLATIDQHLTSTGLESAGVAKVDEIAFFQGRKIDEVRSLGRTIVTRISVTLGVPVYTDVFGTSGYPGDGLSELGLAQGRGRNTGVIPLG